MVQVVSTKTVYLIKEGNIMKKYIGIITLAFALVSMTACNKEEITLSEDSDLITTPLTISVNLDEASKTTLVDGTKVRWAEGDKFYGFHKYGENQAQTEVLEFILKSGAGTAEASFETKEGTSHHEIAAGDVLIGIYGCELNEAGTLPMWPAAQLASTTGTPMTGTTVRNIASVPMFAKATATSEGAFNNMTFKNGGGLLQINVTNNTEADISPDMLYIDSKFTCICGEFHLPTFDGEGNPSIEFTGNANHTISWKFNDPTKVVGKTTTVPLNIAFPAGSYKGLKFTYTGNFGTIPYGFIRTMKEKDNEGKDVLITIHRNKIDQLSMNLYKELPVKPDSPVGSIGSFTDMADPHHPGGRTGMIVGFDFTEGTGKPKSKLVICTANMVLNGKTEVDGQEAAWNKGSLVKYNETNSHTSGGHWRLMTVNEANAVIATDEHGSGIAQWGTLNGVQGIYWYFDPARYSGEFGANVVPNSIFLPVTHNNVSENNRAEGRYWLDGNYYFEFWQNPSDTTKGIVNVIYDKDLATSDHLGAIRLVHDLPDTTPTI